MRLPEDPGFPVLPPAQPTRDLLLAQALDACITAERRLPGSAQEIIARQPAWARADLQRLIGLAGSLDAAASNAIMSSEFRVAARARLMQRIGGDASAHSEPPPLGPVRLTAFPNAPTFRRRKTFWVWRATAGGLAAVLAVAATLTASASALPGEPLYGLKQAQEELGVRLASDDQQRALALLRQADARLDETARLLQLGRTGDASVTTQQYDQVLERAMSSYVVTVEDVPQPAPATVHMEARLTQEQDQLQALLESAPEQARPDLREALVATERGRALVADPRPVEQALGRIGRSDASVAAAVPTMAAEDSPTVVPTAVPARPTTLALQRPLAVLPTPTPPPVVVADSHDDGQPGEQNTTLNSVERAARGPAASSGGSRPSAPPSARTAPAEDQDSNQHANANETTPGAPPVVLAHGDRHDGVDGSVRGDGSAPSVDRTDMAALINGRPVGSQSDSHTNETDTGRGRGDGVPQAIVARATAEPADNNDSHAVIASGGGRPNGGDVSSGGTATGGASARAEVPARGNPGGTTTSASTTTTTGTTSSSTSASSQRSGHDNGVETRAAPTPTATPSRPQPVATSTARHGGEPAPAPAPAPARGDSPPRPNPQPAPRPSSEPHR